ncbi:hypothetical protein M073_0089 [Bacteroides fragilis str. DS-71]|nr:hypothetical protein M073_0089 [Bacteroides fragilis str. DS-71]
MHKIERILSYCQYWDLQVTFFLISMLTKRYPADCLPDIYINSKHF